MPFNSTKVFISHASENKDAIARSLANLLANSVQVWFDEYSIEPGDSIFSSINKGLASCDFGVVILSKEFFKKKWTQAELAGLFGREDFGAKIIPVWHEVSYTDVSGFSPIMADRKAIKSAQGVQAVAEFILQGIKSNVAGNKDSFIHTGTVDTLFTSLGNMISTSSEKEALYNSKKGADKVFKTQSEFFAVAEKRITEIATAIPQLKLSWKADEFRCIPNDKIYLNITAPGNHMLRFEGTRPSQISTEIARIEIALFILYYDSIGLNQQAKLIESHTFLPKFNDQLAVLWQKDGERLKSNQELIDFGLARLHEFMSNWHQKRYQE